MNCKAAELSLQIDRLELAVPDARGILIELKASLL